HCVARPPGPRRCAPRFSGLRPLSNPIFFFEGSNLEFRPLSPYKTTGTHPLAEREGLLASLALRARAAARFNRAAPCCRTPLSISRVRILESRVHRFSSDFG